MPAIELQNVTKRYDVGGPLHTRSVFALDALDLVVDRGDVFGFLGPNGAGKSTTIELLLGLSQPTSGSVRVLDEPVTPRSVDLRRRIGVLPEGHAPIGERTGREHLEFAITAKNASDDPGVLLDRVGLDTVGNVPVRQYSKGMSQRLMLAVALVGDPELLILDEPTTGLDPNGARLMREIVRTEAARGSTVFFSSHILAQVDAVCDRVGIIDHGTLVRTESLHASGSGQITVRVEFSSRPDDLVSELKGISGVESVADSGTELSIRCRSDRKIDVLDCCFASQLQVTDVEIKDRSLDALFDAATGRQTA